VARTTALVLALAIFGIILIVLIGMALGHNGNLATAGISSLALVAGGSSVHAWDRKKKK